jgi:hypothetical protein
MAETRLELEEQSSVSTQEKKNLVATPSLSLNSQEDLLASDLVSSS